MTARISVQHNNFMSASFPLFQFALLFPDDEGCLEQIRKLRYPRGIFCILCNMTTKHYKVAKRMAYTCKFCRTQVYPLSGTIFEKTTTPLRLWFYAMYLLIQSRGEVSAKQLQRELRVTYKTAWRMRSSIMRLLQQNDGDLLQDLDENAKVRKWTFFNALELRVVQKQGASG